MNGSQTRLDPLRERLLKPELSWARSTLAAQGGAGLVAAAATCLQEIAAARLRFEALARAIAGGPEPSRAPLIAQYLRDTVADSALLADDLRALARGGSGVLDLSALGERLARDCDGWECRAEACLALARSAPEPREPAQVEPVLALACAPGRWSRRLEAIGWLASLDLATRAAALRGRVLSTLAELTSRHEQRWVQPAALAALAQLDGPAAHAIMHERLSQPGPGDDWLVRASMVRLIGLRKHARWLDILTLAHDDSSEHVRITAARVQMNGPVLERIARADLSHRVRASALIRLARRPAAESLPALCRALRQDADGFVVQTAAEEGLRWARRRSDSTAVVLATLAEAAQRAELPASARGTCRDALVELQAMRDLSPAVLQELRAALQATPIAGSRLVESERLAGLSDAALARALAVVARDDFGIGVDRTVRGLVLHRGERTSFSLWRALFELRHPAPDKRQGVSHVVARRLPGALRSPPGGLAEVTATRVPGQRVCLENSGDWGRELPRVEDLLGQGLGAASATRIASALGVARVVPAASFTTRVRGFCALLLRYASLAESRQRALQSDDPLVRASFAREVLRQTGSTLEVVPYVWELGPTPAPEPAADEPAPKSSVGALAIAPLLPFGSSLSPTWERLRELALPSHDVALSYLAGYGVLLLGALIARQAVIRRHIAAERSAIPLVIGGWGTRGKSGSERLKAALFQGLGYECLVKTTGCEAMFIHAIPGLPAREVFIYRPYDKATVWEQRNVLSLAARLGVRAFLWECMALQPELVNLLQMQWMRDDLSTITNTYPDHEDVQGPSGLDVAQTIAEFVPQRGTAFTTEQQMLPLLKARAAARGTRLISVPPRDIALIADDLRARFGHAEHPANIALVAALARRAGVPEDVAIAEMADHVVADLGALKTYPTVSWRGRRLSFTNGMGANDRAATLENWQRAGFHVDPPAPTECGWVVTVVNNRADRPARSRVFAELLVKDIVADCHVLIGTNLPGLQRAIARALDQQVHALSPSRDLPEDPAVRERLIAERLSRAFSRLRIRGTDLPSIALEAARLNVPLPSLPLVERLLASSEVETYEAAKQRVSRELTAAGEGEASPFLVALIAKRRIVRALTALAGLVGRGASLDAQFAAAYRAIFLEGMVCHADSRVSGDYLIDSLATQLPVGATARIMGLQNIKGTGLDFVYRWVSIESVARLCAGLHSGDSAAREQALIALMVHDDYGVVDASLARDALAQASRRDPQRASRYEAAQLKLGAIAAQREASLGAKRGAGWLNGVRRIAGETLDFADAIRRRGMAARVLDSLAAAHISHASAALQMRRILQRAKGGWLMKQA